MSPQNLQVLRPSRKALKPGDVFTMRLFDDSYLFGRVISTEARWSIAEDGGKINLVYVFKHRSPAKELPERADLRADRLLIPPQLVNRLGWSRGYFETLETLPFEAGDVLAVHCFETNSYRSGPRWFDEQANELPEPIRPVGQFGAGNYRTLEDEVCRALGIPLASPH